jgi:hypothetical protein
MQPCRRLVVGIFALPVHQAHGLGVYPLFEGLAAKLQRELEGLARFPDA